MGRPNKFDGMMHEFCVDLGWCGSVEEGRPLHVTDFIPETGSVSADEFARWILLAEGFESDELSDAEARKWIREFKAVFVKHMGADVVDASYLRSGSDGA